MSIKRIKKKAGIYLQEVRAYRENGKLKQESIRYIGKEKEIKDIKVGDIFFDVSNESIFRCTAVSKDIVVCQSYNLLFDKLDTITLYVDAPTHIFYEGSLALVKEILSSKVFK